MDESSQQQQESQEQQNDEHFEMPEETEEMDLTPYEEDDDATLHRKLVASKLTRKRAEEDLKLLNNRINLLRAEEKRAYKKIDQTKKKAGDIVSQR